MGVPGLWDILRPAAARQSLATLSRHAFQTSPRRALTIGVDASIWIFHAQIPSSGENPFLRTIFFKITSLLQHPILPIFVFDGPDKPGYKRNQRIGGGFGTSDSRSRMFKELLDEMGLEWWNAPGEAEAELAIMNRQGKIDAVLSDDVDALLFGATCLIRNNSPTLTGNNKSAVDKGGYDVYRSDKITETMTSKEGTALTTEDECRLAMVFIALFAGGDYVPEGLETFGPVIAHGLAHAGMADILKLYLSDPAAFRTELSFTHGKIVEELRTNSTGHVGKRYVERANKVGIVKPEALFPTSALDAYLRPSTSVSRGLPEWPGFGLGERSIRRGKTRNEGRGDLEGMARACEKFFEWGTKDFVVRRFVSEAVGVYTAEIVNAARNITLARGRRRSRSPSPEPAVSSSQAASAGVKSFFQVVKPSSQVAPKASQSGLRSPSPTSRTSMQIQSTRDSPTDIGETDYRISYEHHAFSSRVRSAMSGTRVDPKDLDADMRAALGLVDREKETALAPIKSEQRVWIPAYLMMKAWPRLVNSYEGRIREKEEAKLAKANKAGSSRVKAVVKSTRAKASVAAPESAAFKNFFSATGTSSTAGPSRSRKEASGENTTILPELAPLDSESDSDIEIIETPAVFPVKSNRLHPTSSLSSVGSSASALGSSTPPRRQTRSGAAGAVTRQVSPRATRSTRTVGRTSKTRSKTPPPSEVIDLCDSSDQDTPRATRTGSVLSASGADNLTSPVSARRTPRSPKKKSRTVGASPKPKALPKALGSTQPRLDLQVLGSSSQNSQTRKTTPKKAKSRVDDTEMDCSPPVRSRGKKHHPVVLLSETEDEEIIEVIRRG